MAGVKPLLCEADMGEIPCSYTPTKFVGPSASAYTAIRNIRIKTYQAPDIYGKPYQLAINEAIYMKGDTTASKVRVVSSLVLNRTISSTFETSNMICRACPSSHTVG